MASSCRNSSTRLAATYITIPVSFWRGRATHATAAWKFVLYGDHQLRQGRGPPADGRQGFVHWGNVEVRQRAEPKQGKLGLAFHEFPPPRLVVDPSISGANAACVVPGKQIMPSAFDVIRSLPLRNLRKSQSALSLDIQSPHKRIVLKAQHRGLVGFSWTDSLFF